MLKRLLLIIPILTVLTFFATQSVNAQEEILQEFCDRRKGDVINLETWYAGTCDPEDETSTFSGAKLGFGDIIILHFYELLAGEGSEDGEEVIRKIFEELQNVPLGDNQKQVNYLSLLQNMDFSSEKQSNGLVPTTGRFIAKTLSRPPVQTYEYVASVRSNMAKHSLVQPAYAQNTSGQGGGYGFANFQGFLPMWRAFRNISYFFFVLAFVAYGFAIMFRLKLGQAAVTVQQALPKLIVTLLLITFSYAIVGLLIDFMWVLYYVVLNTLGAFQVFGSINPTTNVAARILSGQFGLIPSAFLQSVIGFFIGIPSTISAILGLPLGSLYVIGIGGTLLASVVSGGTAGAAVGAGVLLIGLIFLIGIFISFAKLFIKLITAYVNIIGNLILAPLILLPDAIPGRGGAFQKWLNNLIANIVVFPVASILLLFSGFFLLQPILQLPVVNGSPLLSGYNSLQAPPRVPLLNPEILSGSVDASSWMGLIGLALLLMAPKFVDMIKESFGVKGALGFALGETFAGGAGGAYAAAEAYKARGEILPSRGAGIGENLQRLQSGYQLARGKINADQLREAAEKRRGSGAPGAGA